MKTHDDIIKENKFCAIAELYKPKHKKSLVQELFDKDGWRRDSFTHTWKKLVPSEEEGEREVLKVIVDLQYCDNMVDKTEYFYEVFGLCKNYLKANNVFYHEPLAQMPSRCKIAVIFACAVKYDNVKNKVFKNQQFTGFLGI